jgi:hypothetical protein
MEVCYWALLFMPLVILHHLLNVFVQLANKRGFTTTKNLLERQNGDHIWTHYESDVRNVEMLCEIQGAM